MAATSDWWHFDSRHAFLALAVTAAVGCVLFISWKVAQMVRIARKRQLLARHIQDGYVFLGETSVVPPGYCCSPEEDDTRHYRVLEAAQQL